MSKDEQIADQWQRAFLEWVPLRNTYVQGPLYGLDVPEMRTFYRLVFDQLWIDMRTRVLAYTIDDFTAHDQRTVYFDLPASPWQHFKQHHMRAWWMRWLVTRRPVRTIRLSRTVRMTATWTDRAAYPWQNAIPVTTRLGTPVRMVEMVVSSFGDGPLDREGDSETPSSVRSDEGVSDLRYNTSG